MPIDIDELRRRAEAGITSAQAHLGHLYLTGEAVEQDYTQAFRWIKAAADQGAFIPVAMLGRMYEEGLGTEKDLKEAYRLYRDAALRGNLGCALNLARKYRDGNDLKRNDVEAAIWYAVATVLCDGSDDSYRETYDFLFQSLDTMQALVAMLNSDVDNRLRYYGALAIAKLNIVEVLPALYMAADDPSRRKWVAEAFGYVQYWRRNSFPSKAEVTKLLLRLMDDPDPDVRCAAAESISAGKHNKRRTRTRLRQALDDPSDCVQQVALLALARFGDREIRARLEARLLSDNVAPHHVYAAAALGDVSLLSAVQAGATRLHRIMTGREEFEHAFRVQQALESLEQAAAKSNGSTAGIDVH